MHEKIQKRIRFNVKPRYYLELLTPQTKKLLGSTKEEESQT